MDSPKHSASKARWRKSGLAGDVAAGKIALREFFVIAKTCRPIWIQLALAAIVLTVALLRTFVWDIGFGFYSWMLFAIVFCLGLYGEANNTVHERTGDAIARLVVAFRQIRDHLELPDHAGLEHPPDGEHPEHNELSREIKDGGAATMSPIFFLGVIVYFGIMIHG